MFVSLATYAKPENRTRALTLVRLAVNLGFAAGPALGGLIIMGMGYKGTVLGGWFFLCNCYFNICTFGKRKEKTLVKIPHATVLEVAQYLKIKFSDLFC
jgi:predicted MFS family arabinose efflux permease